jgi:hypothetical protein
VPKDDPLTSAWAIIVALKNLRRTSKRRVAEDGIADNAFRGLPDIED